MVDVATLRQVALATGGSRGGMLTTTSDGRVLLSMMRTRSTSSIRSTHRRWWRQIRRIHGRPFRYRVSVRFGDVRRGYVHRREQRRRAACSTRQTALHGAAARRRGRVPWSTMQPIARATSFGNMGGRLYAHHPQIALKHLRAAPGERQGHPFTAISDLSATLDVRFTNTRYDSATRTVSYDVTITNMSDAPIVLPALLLLDPVDGYKGIPTTNVGRTDDGRWLIDLSQSLPLNSQNVRELAKGATSHGSTPSPSLLPTTAGWSFPPAWRPRRRSTTHQPSPAPRPTPRPPAGFFVYDAAATKRRGAERSAVSPAVRTGRHDDRRRHR